MRNGEPGRRWLPQPTRRLSSSTVAYPSRFSSKRGLEQSWPVLGSGRVPSLTGQGGSRPGRGRVGRAHRHFRTAAFENPRVSRRSSWAAPTRRRTNPITRCRAHQAPFRYAGTDDRSGTRPQRLDTRRLALMSGYPVAAVRRAFVVSYSCLDLTDSSTSSAATTWSSFIAASQRRPCEELKQPPSSKTSSRKTRKSSWRGSRATTGEGTSDRPATTPETAAAERPAIDTTACTRPRRGRVGCSPHGVRQLKNGGRLRDPGRLARG